MTGYEIVYKNSGYYGAGGTGFLRSEDRAG